MLAPPENKLRIEVIPLTRDELYDSREASPSGGPLTRLSANDRWKRLLDTHCRDAARHSHPPSGYRSCLGKSAVIPRFLTLHSTEGRTWWLSVLLCESAYPDVPVI